MFVDEAMPLCAERSVSLLLFWESVYAGYLRLNQVLRPKSKREPSTDSHSLARPQFTPLNSTGDTGSHLVGQQ